VIWLVLIKQELFSENVQLTIVDIGHAKHFLIIRLPKKLKIK